MSDSNRTALLYARESAYKTPLPPLPAQDSTGTNTMFNLRFTKESLDAGKETITSEEIRSDRMVSALVEVGVKATGGFDSELLYQDYDDIFAAALMADNNTSVTQSCNIAHSAGTITTTTGTPFKALALANPKHVLIAGATNATNNGYKIVASVSNTVITLAAGQLTTDESASSLTISMQGTAELDAVTANISFSISSTTNIATIVYTATAGTFSTNVQAARYVAVAGSASAGNNGNKKVVSCTGTVLTVQQPALGTEGITSGESITVFCNYIRTGITYVTHFLEKQFLDVPHYMQFTGMGVDTLDLKLEARKIGGLSFAFMGYKGAESAASIVGTTIASTTNVPMNCAANVGTIYKDGNAVLNPVKTLSLKVNNNIRERPILSDLGSAAHGQGRSEITGQMEVYFSNKEMLREFLNHTQMSLELNVQDVAGNAINFFMPAVQSTKATPIATAVNTDVMQTITFQAFKDATKGYQLQIDRV